MGDQFLYISLILNCTLEYTDGHHMDKLPGSRT